MNLPFTEYDFYALCRQTFVNNELERIKRLLPLQEIVESFGLTGRALRPKPGRWAYFTPASKVVLMFLKMYIGLSRPKLMEPLNENIHYQLFCDMRDSSFRTGELQPTCSKATPTSSKSSKFRNNQVQLEKSRTKLIMVVKVYLVGG